MGDATGERDAGAAAAGATACAAGGEAKRKRAGAARAGGPGSKLSAAQRGLFLDTLSETGNVIASAAKAGALPGTFYRLRDRDKAFAAAWATAVECGVQMLESWLIAIAMGQPSPAGFDPILAMTIVQQRRSAAVRHPHGGQAVRVKHVPITEVQKEVLRRLSALARRRRPRGGREAV